MSYPIPGYDYPRCKECNEVPETTLDKEDLCTYCMAHKVEDCG